MPLLAADWYILVNPLMPIVAMFAIIGWGWLISSKLDKDAQFFHLPRRQWNTAHLIAGLVGFAIMVSPVPQPWWFAISLPVGLIVAMSTVLAYWYYRNGQVPEDQVFHLSADRIQAAMQRRAAAKATRAATMSFVDAEGTRRIPPDQESKNYAVHIQAEELISPAILGRATRIDVLPSKGGSYQISQIVDSVRYRRNQIEPKTAHLVMEYLKSHAGLDPADVRRRQVGDMALVFGTEEHDLRVRTAGSSSGQTLSVDIDIKKHINIKPKKLGLLPSQMDALDSLVSDAHGVTLIVTPAGGGRTTTMYSLLRRHDAFTSNIRTLEIEHLLQIDGVGHTQFEATEDGANFATQLRSILRRDPHIVMVSDLVDVQTAQEAAGPGLKGPLVYVGMRGNSGLEGLATWCKAIGDLEAASAPIKAIISQRLVRKLCDCKAAYKPAPDQLKKLGLPADQVKKLYKPSGKIIDRNKEIQCPLCGGVGYRGVTAIYEVMIFGDDARALIAKGDLNGLRPLMAHAKMLTVQQAGLRKAIDGVTSIEEVIRATKTNTSASAKNKTQAAKA